MSLIKRQTPPIWQILLIPAGMFLVLGLALTIELVFLDNLQLGRMSTYDLAPVCASAAEVSKCRYQGSAHIVRTWFHNNNPVVEVAFDDLGGRKVTAYVDGSNTPEWRTWQAEDTVSAELWDGHLVVVAGVKTNDNPDSFPATSYIDGTLASGVTTLVLGALFAWWMVLYLRARRERQANLAAEHTEHPSATQGLPLTPDMTGYLKAEGGAATNYISDFAFILGAAAVIPALFTVVFILQNTWFQWLTAILWAGFLGLGVFVAVVMLHDFKLERRDLLGGVFVRRTGPFEVKVVGRYGASVQVVVGGRKLSTQLAQSLVSIESGIGTVDYFPACGDLLEVRDESGNVLWNRFAPVHGTPSVSDPAP